MPTNSIHIALRWHTTRDRGNHGGRRQRRRKQGYERLRSSVWVRHARARVGNTQDCVRTWRELGWRGPAQVARARIKLRRILYVYVCVRACSYMCV